jgi:hypothetical protein
LHQLVVRETELLALLRERDKLQASIKEMEAEIVSQTQRIGVCPLFCHENVHYLNLRRQNLDVQILESQGPIDQLEQEQEQFQREANERLSRAQEEMQAVNLSVQNLENTNRVITR